MSEISYNAVCFQNKSLGNWQEDQRMKSVIWKVVCMLQRFLQKSLHFPGSNIKSYSARPAIFFGISVQTRIWKKPSCDPHQDFYFFFLFFSFLAPHRTLLTCNLIISSSRLDSCFKSPQMALNAYTVSCLH